MIYCFGTNCPLTDSCLRYKEKIKPRKEYHLAYAPYNADRKRCGFYLGSKVEEFNNSIDEIIKRARSVKDDTTV